jgi:hypothetical protein
MGVILDSSILIAVRGVETVCGKSWSASKPCLERLPLHSRLSLPWN